MRGRVNMNEFHHLTIPDNKVIITMVAESQYSRLRDPTPPSNGTSLSEIEGGGLWNEVNMNDFHRRDSVDNQDIFTIVVPQWA